MTVVPVLPSSRRRRWWRCPAWALVIVVPGVVVAGADLAIPALLKPLGVVAYSPRTTPPDFVAPPSVLGTSR